ncbi:MAG: transposase [Elusimicrobia bacterium]|nr:transposase [Elusimicrobiota bacterium]
MVRPLRLTYEGAVYHITSRGNARMKIFHCDTDRQEFLRVLGSVIERYKWVCHGYCLMSNHYHLIIETPSGNLSIGMRQLNGVYTQSSNRKHKSCGHIFQGRFKAIHVEKGNYLLELSRYIVLNPVRAKMCKSPEQYEWSSYRSFIGIEKPPAFLFVDWVLSQFSNKRTSAIKDYTGFVKEGYSDKPWERLVGQIYYGSNGFIERIKSGNEELKEVPKEHLQPLKPALKKLLVEENGMVKAYKEYGYKLKEIAKELNVHYATVSRKLKKQELRMCDCKT